MLEDNDLLPVERDEHNQQLIADIRHSYINREDKQSLTRIRERLVRNVAGSLPIPDPTVKIPTQTTRSRQERSTDMHFIHTDFCEGKTRHQQLGTLAAAVLVTLLVGSLATVLYIRLHQSVLGSQPPLSYGWKQVATFSGTDSKTITHLNIQLTALWGSSIGCVGKGDIKFELVETYNNLVSGCTVDTPSAMNSSTTPQLEPQVFQFSSPSRRTIHTIKVTVSGSLTWYVRLASADVARMPFLNTLATPLGVGASGGPDAISTSSGFANASKTWGLIMQCAGKGVFQVALFSPGGQGVDAPCDGKTHFSIIHYSTVTQPLSVKARITVNGEAFVEVVVCQNEQKCSTL